MAAEVMSARELAELLGLTEGTVYKKVRRGEIPAARIGRSIRFPRRLIEGWLQTEARAEAKPAARVADPGRFTVTTCGGLRTSLRREALYRGR